MNGNPVFKKVVTCLCVIVVGLSAGWGRDGHRIVAKIAADNLEPAASAAVKTLLDDQTMAEVALWADDVRSSPQYKWSAPHHYADLDGEGEEFRLDRDCPEQGCVVGAILEHITTLSGDTADKSRRIEAVMFLIHFVGDIHQPLHVGRSEDKGGNSIRVRFDGRSMKLHALWDSALIERAGIPWESYAGQLKTAITPQQKMEWSSNLDPADWATESHRLAMTNAYEMTSSENLGDTYYQTNKPVVESQLSKAGIRLAAMLNALFVTPPSPVPGHATGGTHETKLVGSRRRDVYHYANCRVVNEINPENLVEYEQAPPGKRLHKDCPW